MIIKTLDNDDIIINNFNNISDIYDILLKKNLNIINKNSIILISNNTILNNDNIHNFKDNNVYLYINKYKNTIKINDIIEDIFKVNINIYDDNNLNILIEMGFDEELSNEILENNENNLINSINYLINL